jgi:hypothetical protein
MRILLALVVAVVVGCTGPAALPSPSPASPSPTATASPTGTPGADATPAPPGTTPFPTPGPTLTPGSTRVIGTILRADGSPAQGVCVVLEVGICPIATDERGTWFTDIPAGSMTWNFVYKVKDQEVGRQVVTGSSGGELRLPAYTLTG